MSLGRKRNSHGFPMRVSCGSVPPIITGLPSFRMSGAIAWSWVLRMEPMNAGISLSPASLLNARTAPGLVVWSSSMTSSNARPSTPPALFTSSTASFAPLIWNRPDSAPGPVSGATMPIFSLSAAAADDATSAAAARPVAILRSFAFMLSPFALVLWIENSRTGPEVSLGMGAQSIGIIVTGAIEKWPELYRNNRPAEDIPANCLGASRRSIRLDGVSPCDAAEYERPKHGYRIRRGPTMSQLNSYYQIEKRKSLGPELQAARLPFLDRPFEQCRRAVNAVREFAVRQHQEKRH